MRFANILMVAAAQGGGGASGPYGPELVVNGNFATNSDWSGSGWTIAAGIYNGTASSLPKTGTNTSAANLEIGATYHTVFTVTSVTAGGVSVLVGGQAGTLRSTPGTYTEDIVCDDTFPPRVQTDFGPSTVSVDNVSFKKVL